MGSSRREARGLFVSEGLVVGRIWYVGVLSAV